MKNMMPDLFKIKQTLEPQKGRVLISQPFMNDGIFGRSVVLLTEHNDEGSVGFILNKFSGFTIHQLLPLFKNYKMPVFIGGPVATNTIHFIYKAEENLAHSQKIDEGLYWGGDIHKLHDYLKNNKIHENDIRFFVGYSGWGKNQLNDELKKEYWIVNHFDKELYFEEKDFSKLWKRNVILLDKKYHFWLNVPINPMLN